MESLEKLQKAKPSILNAKLARRAPETGIFQWTALVALKNSRKMDGNYLRQYAYPAYCTPLVKGPRNWIAFLA